MQSCSTVRYALVILMLMAASSWCFGQTVFGGEQVIVDQSGETDGVKDVYSSDLDGDGDMDVLSASSNDDKIAWYQNDGNGNFSAQQVISTNTDYPVSVYAADLDGDGDPDVLSASFRDNKIAWYQNDGSGNFTEQQVISTNADGASSVYAADLDGDGDLDVLSASNTDDKIAWYQNDGDGNFSAQQVISTNAYRANSVYAADMDGDGDPDVLSAYYFDTIAWYQNDGNGSFSGPQVISATADRPISVYAADIDGDGDPDVLSASSNDNKIAWYRNYGSGGFSAEYVISTNADHAQSVYVADMDGDGDPDVLSASSFDDKIAWYQNDGNGNFSDQQVISTYADGARSVYAADLDGDGDPDVLSASEYDDKIAWYQNDGNGIFPAQQFITTTANGASSVYAADLDGDGDSDVLSASKYDDKIAWYQNDGNGVFSTQQLISTYTNEAWSVYATDLDADGDVDVLSASALDQRIAWYQNDGNGNFSVHHTISLNADYAKSVYAADLDGDGDPDVLSASGNDNKIAWYQNDGIGNFSDEQVISTNARWATSVYAADLEGDGDMDVLSASSTDDKIAWYQNDGNGNFVEQVLDTSNTDSPRAVTAADLDGDGDQDVLSAYDDKIAWYENDGNGIFSAAQMISTNADYAKSVYAADLDGDGDPDVLSASGNDNKIAWYQNDGFGNFSAEQVISTNADGANSVYAADLDGDGDMDVLSASPNDHKIAWYENLLGDDLTTITGQVYWDKNEDGVFNGNDDEFSGHRLLLQPNDQSFYTDQDGNFSVITRDSGSHTITVLPPVLHDCDNLIDFDLTIPSDLPFTFEYEAFLNLEQDFVFEASSNQCRTISGIVWEDENQNGIQDNGESGLGGIKIWENLSSQFTYSNSDGEYSFSLPTGQQVAISAQLIDDPTNGYCVNDYTIITQTFPPFNDAQQIIAGEEDVTDVNFGIYVNEQSSFDVGLYSLMVMNGNAAGETFHAFMDFKANGTITEACTLRIEHDPLLTLFQSNIPVTSQSPTFVEWVFPSGSAPDWYCMQMDWYLDSAAVEGDTLHWEASYECPPGIDACPENNLFIRDIPIISGPLRMATGEAILYSMEPAGVMPEVIEQGEVLSYVISFQNPLPTTAYNITITDQLSEHLDLYTVSQPFSSFPDYEFVIGENGFLRWELNDINLADANEDELNSYGFVQFNVALKDDLPIETLIPNSATVIFNGTESVETNEIIHILRDLEPPEAVCVELVNVLLDEDGIGELTALEVDGGSSDNFEIIDYVINLVSFDCSHINVPLFVVLSVSDASMNTSNCMATLEVLDNLPPEITCQDISLEILEGQTEEIDIEDVVLTATDNCITVTSELSQMAFNAINEGSNEVTITTSDASGNSIGCTINVEVSVVTGVIDLLKEISVTIKPNPFRNQTTFSLSESLPFAYDLRLYDVLGKETRQYENLETTQTVIESGALAKGVYFLNLYKSGSNDVLGSWKLVVE